MKKIAILRCLHSNDVCTGHACLQAFNNRSKFFANYGTEPLQLVAFSSCDGCGSLSFNSPRGLTEKIQALIKMQPDAVHIGVCAQKKTAKGDYSLCSGMLPIVEELQSHGIKIIMGTH